MSNYVQINETDVYKIGGHPSYVSLLTRNYKVTNACLKINITSGELIQKADMLNERMYFSVCFIGNLVYSVGGYKYKTGKYIF